MQVINVFSNKLIIKILILFVIGNIIFISCKKEEPGPPVITQIRLPDPDKADSTFTQADPGTLIVIQGENLGGVLHVYFNDYEASFNSVFTTDNNIIIWIPGEAPTEVIDPDVPHEIRVVTDHGEATYTFVLTPPPPGIFYISNENAPSGEDIFILGSDFYLIEKIVFPGDLETSDFTVNKSASMIEVTVPEGLSDTGRIAIVTSYHTVESPMPFNNLSQEGTICNFDNINTYIWGCQIISDNTTFYGARGNFAHLVSSDVGAGNYTWWEDNRVCYLAEMQQIISPENMGDLFTEYALKFEIYVKEIWNTGQITIVTEDDWNWRYIYSPWLINGVRTDFVTDGWITVVIPLTEFRDGEGTGDPATSFSDILASDGTGHIGLAFMNTTPDPDNVEADAILLENLSIGIDNIRVVNIAGD
ncbi:MAG: IPT/TIG domain-containing protein [Bacteroidales bacterium]|nr:MAG: IPT/TIG domain-containing protein [Bacteroidales bacterium]